MSFFLDINGCCNFCLLIGLIVGVWLLCGNRCLIVCIMVSVGVFGVKVISMVFVVWFVSFVMIW